MTETPAISDVPIIVLGSHRSGTSLVTGLLTVAGMAIGDPLQAGPDNPRGFYESAAVWRAHEAILAAIGRDWTRPPATIAPNMVDLTALRSAAGSIAASAEGRWGVKDPRTMFLLPLWADIVPRMQLVGVVRDPNAIASSLVGRNGFSADRALAIAHGHTQRLAELHRRLGFPLVEFTTDRVAVLGRVKQLARALELEWDGSAAEALFERALIHQVPGEAAESDDYRYLATHAVDAIEQVAIVESSDLVAALQEIDSSGVDIMDRMAVAASPAPSRSVPDLLEQLGRLEGDLRHRDNLIGDLREELAKVEARLGEEIEGAMTERRELEAALAAAEERLEIERERHRAAAEALLSDNASLRHWLLESRNTLAWREADLENERRKVAALTRFFPKRLAGSVWRRFVKKRS